MVRSPNHVPERFRCIPRVELLEDRCLLATGWGAKPPAKIKVPKGQLIELDGGNNFTQFDQISGKKADFFRFEAPVTGVYRFAAQTPVSSLDPVAALYNKKGKRIAFNNNQANPPDEESKKDSQFTVNLKAGKRYYFGVHKRKGTPKGEYFWLIDGPNIDAYEANNTSGTATQLGVVTDVVKLNLNYSDEDWFQFQLDSPGVPSSFVRIDFSHAQGDLNLQLYAANGGLIATSDGITDTELISLSGQPAGTYRVRIYAAPGVTNPSYKLSIANGDDEFEHNDSPANPFDLGTINGTFTLTNLAMTDVGDFYRFVTTAPATPAHTVQIQFDNTLGDLALQLRNSNGVILKTSDGNTNTETLSLAGLPAGFYTIGVYGAVGGVTNPSYSMTIEAPGTSDPGTFQIDLIFNGLTESQKTVFRNAANRWAQIITGDLPDAPYSTFMVDDILISASAVFIDGLGGILGQAGPNAFRPISQLPIHGFMEFDSADLADMEADGTLDEVILHEMGHVLGVGTLWSPLNLVVGAGGADPRFTGPLATAEYNSIFGTSDSGVPIENQFGPGTRDVHWRESVFDHELMTGIIELPTVNMPISRVTVASLADMGYQVNLNAADPYNPLVPIMAPLMASATAPAGNGWPALIRLDPVTDTQESDTQEPPLPGFVWTEEQRGDWLQPAPVAKQRPADPAELPRQEETTPFGSVKVWQTDKKDAGPDDAFEPFWKVKAFDW